MQMDDLERHPTRRYYVITYQHVLWLPLLGLHAKHSDLSLRKVLRQDLTLRTSVVPLANPLLGLLPGGAGLARGGLELGAEPAGLVVAELEP